MALAVGKSYGAHGGLLAPSACLVLNFTVVEGAEYGSACS
jgi:hypothetical protein